jgi:hypothetical protein
MSAYAIVNLKEEVEDSWGESAPGTEGRFARKHLDSEHLGVSYLRLSPGVRSPRAFEAGDDGLELIAIGSDRPDGGDGVFAPTAWID